MAQFFPFSEMAPAPLSRAAAVGKTCFLSGQGPFDPETGDVYVGDDFAKQTRLVMEAIQKTLTDVGGSFDAVVKATIYTTDLRQSAAINEVYASYFTTSLPARTMVQVAALPRNMGVEIEMVVELPA